MANPTRNMTYTTYSGGNTH